MIRLLSEGEMQQILAERHLVKPNKWQIGLLQPLKISLNFSVLKLLNIKLELERQKDWNKTNSYFA